MKLPIFDEDTNCTNDLVSGQMECGLKDVSILFMPGATPCSFGVKVLDDIGNSGLIFG